MKKRSARWLSLLLALTLLTSLLPGAAFAAEQLGGGEAVSTLADETENAAPAPAFMNSSWDLSTKSAEYYQGDTIAALSFWLKPNAAAYNTTSLTYEWQSSDDGETFTKIEGAPDEWWSATMPRSKAFTPEVAAGQTKYFRASVTNKGLEEGMTPTTIYTAVAKITVHDMKRPAVILDKPVVRDAEGKLQEDAALTVTFSNPNKTLPYENTTFGKSGKGNVIRLKNDAWDTENYLFAGWQIRDTFYAAKDYTEKGNADIAPADGNDWKGYLKEYTDTYDWSLDLYYADDNYSIDYNGKTATILQSFHITPVFEKFATAAYKITLTETDGGTIKKARTEAESYQLTATASPYYTFVRWEQSVNGGDWTTLEGGATVQVTLTADTSYRAVFDPMRISTLSVKQYALPSAGDSWFLNVDAALTSALPSATNFDLKIYDGEAAEEDKLLGTSTARGSANASTVTLRADAEKRPSDNKGKILLVATLPNGQSTQTVYTLKGTLDADPASMELDAMEALFLGKGPETIQLTASGDPVVESVTWSGGDSSSSYQNTAVVDKKTGLVQFVKFTSNQTKTFVADAGDGRIAESKIYFKGTRRGLKLYENSLLIAEGESGEYKVQQYDTTILPRVSEGVTAVSSDETVFKAEIITREVKTGMGLWSDVVDKIQITGVGKGEATLTITDKDGDREIVWSCPVVVTSDKEALTSVKLSENTADITVAGKLTLTAETAPKTAAVAAIRWSSSDDGIASVEDGVVTGNKAGTAVITVEATDKLGNTVKDSCTVTVEDAPYQVAVYVPKNTVGENGLHFYPATGSDTQGRDTFDANHVITAVSRDTTSNEDYDVYSMNLKVGKYSFRATDANGKSLGGACFAIPAEADGAEEGNYQEHDNCKINLRLAECSVTNEFNGAKVKAEDFSVTLKNRLGTVTMGDAYTNSEGTACYPALLYVSRTALPYEESATPSDACAKANLVAGQTLSNQSIGAGKTTQAISFTLPKRYAATVTVPAGAALELGIPSNKQGVRPTAVKPEGACVTDTAAGTDTWSFLLTEGVYEYRVRGEGYVTYCGTFEQKNTPTSLTVTREQLQPAGKTSATLDHSVKSHGGVNVGDVLLNANEQGYLKLGAGDSYQLVGVRQWWASNATWVMGTYYVMEPDFHYTVVDLDGKPSSDVITVDETGKIQAKGAGTAIVLVTYDAMTVNYHDAIKTSYDGYDPNGFFGAIWPEDTGVVVVSVGAQDSGLVTGMTINENKELKDKYVGKALDAELDVIYFTGDSGSYTFTPGEGVTAVSVANPEISGGAMYFGGFKPVEKKDGSYTVGLTEGRNIVKVEGAGGAEYQVITAKHVNVQVNGQPLEQAIVEPGQKVSVTFDTLYNPVNRMSVYNTSAAVVYNKVSGTEKTAGNTRGPYGYYFFASTKENQTVEQFVKAGTDDSGYRNSIVAADGELIVPEDYQGTDFVLSDGAFNVGGFSHFKFGEHRTVLGQATSGMSDNVVSFFGKLPDLSIPVGSLMSITVTKKPDVTAYHIGDVFDPTGMVVTATYSNGKSVEISDYTYDAAAFTAAGSKKVTLSYTQGKTTKTADVDVTVSTASVSKIEITTPPAKTVYQVGEAFDPTGMVVTATYSDGTSRAVRGYTCTPEKLQASDKEVTISYGGKTTTVTVHLGLVTRIAITTPPTKTSYTAGDLFNPEGMVVTAYYSDETSAVTTNYSCTPLRRLAVGDTEMTITYTGSDAGEGLQPVTQKITVSKSGGSNPGSDDKSINVSISYSEDGKFVTGAEGTLLSNVDLTVYDKNRDGKYTLGDAFTALHENYYAGGKSGYEEKQNDLGGWVNRFWGDSSGNISYVRNHKWVSGPATEIRNGDTIAVYAYQDLTSYADLYTWFDPDSYTGTTEKAVRLTVKGLNVMQSSETQDMTAVPEGASVTVYDKNDREVSALATTVKKDGTFEITFPSAGTYTVEVGGKCTYTTGGYGGGGVSYTDAPVVPSRCTVAISSGGAAGGAGTGTVNADDQKAANAVIDQIKAIGDVTKDSGDKITAARSAYDKLTEAQKKLVTNYSTLTDAERAYAGLTGKLPFTDVNGHWAYDAIKYAYENSLFAGTSATTFGPNVSMNRAMLVTVLYRLDKEPSAETVSSFKDVPADQWYTKAVAWASANKIVSGYSADTFGPTDTITREQMASILYRYAQYKGYDVSKTTDLAAFTDKASVSDWALTSMQWANAEKLINGRTATTLVPQGNATRAEVAQILMTFAETVAK